MSYYIDGCSQELHCDSFHGPFAYVLSLTQWDGRTFTGARLNAQYCLQHRFLLLSHLAVLWAVCVVSCHSRPRPPVHEATCVQCVMCG